MHNLEIQLHTLRGKLHKSKVKLARVKDDKRDELDMLQRLKGERK